MKLERHVSIVTGAGRGIGRIIAQMLAREGAKVALVARSAEQIEQVRTEIEDCGGKALSIPADVSDPKAVCGMVDRVLDEWGQIDSLVNNAGIFYSPGPLWELDSTKWWNDVTINLLGCYNCAHFVLPHMLERGQGTVINVAGGGAPGPFPYATSYGSSKAALCRFSDTMALELAGSGILTYTTAPGMVRTHMTENLTSTPQGQGWFARMKKGLDEGTGRSPEESGNLILRLLQNRDERLQGRLLVVGANDKALDRAGEFAEKDMFVLRIAMNPPGQSLHRSLEIPTDGSGRCEAMRVIITGAGRGVGRSMAEALAREGASTMVVARTANEVEQVAKGINDQGGKAVGFPADVTEEVQVKAMVAEAVREFGGIDAIVNNAGVQQAIGPVWEVEPETWWKDVTTNLFGAYLCCRHSIPHFLKSGSGMIVNTLGSGAIAPQAGTTAYGAAKAGLARLTDTLAVELQDTDIRTLCFSPGLVKTRMTESILNSKNATRFFGDMRRCFEEGADHDPAEAGELLVRMLTHPDKRLDGRLIAVGSNEAVVDNPALVEGTDHFLLRLKVS